MPVTLRRVPNGGIQPEVARDAAGTLHMVYFAGEPGGGNLFYVRSTDDGDTFSRPIRVNSQDESAIAAGTIRGGTLALGRDGRVHVAWNGSGSALPKGAVDPATGKAGVPMLYARSNDDGSAFEEQRNLMQRSLTLDGGGAVAADASGGVYVAWHGNDAQLGSTGEAHRRVWIARSRDDGRTFAAETPAWKTPTGACGCCGLDLFASRTGGLFALYRSAADGTQRDIYLLRSDDRGTSFQGARIDKWSIPACPMTSMAFADSGSAVLAAWETAGQVHLGAIDRNTPSIAQRMSPPEGGDGRKHPRMAAAADGTVLLVWTEGSAWARGGSVGWQAYDGAGRAVDTRAQHAEVPVWSFAAAVARADGGFTVFH